VKVWREVAALVVVVVEGELERDRDRKERDGPQGERLFREADGGSRDPWPELCCCCRGNGLRRRLFGGEGRRGTRHDTALCLRRCVRYCCVER
jgi:hypothetical protein